MTNSNQAKTMARNLRAALAIGGKDVSHSNALELVAAALGFPDWNTATARLEAETEVGVRFQQCSPILRIFDETKAREFYCGFLGFQVSFEHRFEPNLPLYMGIERAGLHLHLSEHHGDASPGSTVFVQMIGIRDFHRELSEKQYPYGRPSLEDLPWGKQLEVNDPFGNRIRFNEQQD
jgi:uncharacterized glyoxalase superfamily protein PhnB